MDINTRNRAELKSYFTKNSIPTESNFAELIEGMLNQKEDGIAKSPGAPLSVEAVGDDSSPQRALNLYRNFSDPQPEWILDLNTRTGTDENDPMLPGLNVADGEGNSRLFINRHTGNVGLGTANVNDKRLTVRAKETTQELLGFEAPDGQLTWHMNQNVRGAHPGLNFAETGVADGRLFIAAGGNVGIGTIQPDAKLAVIGVDEGETGIEVKGNVGNSHIPHKDGSIYLTAYVGEGKNGKFIFRTYDGSQYANRLVVDGATGVIKQEAWQEVANNPFESRRFQNGWQNYSDEYNGAAYFKDSMGIVHIKGLVKGGSGGINATIFVLPEGYRPAARELRVAIMSGENIARVDIMPNGRVVPYKAHSTWTSLDGITFRAAN